MSEDQKVLTIISDLAANIATKEQADSELREAQLVSEALFRLGWGIKRTEAAASGVFTADGAALVIADLAKMI